MILQTKLEAEIAALKSKAAERHMLRSKADEEALSMRATVEAADVSMDAITI